MYLKKGDLYPPLTIDTNADVTGATLLEAHVRRVHQDQATTYTLTATDVVNGILQYEWQAGDTDVPGTYLVEAVVTFGGGEVQTFPQRNYLELIIREDLA